MTLCNLLSNWAFKTGEVNSSFAVLMFRGTGTSMHTVLGCVLPLVLCKTLGTSS